MGGLPGLHSHFYHVATVPFLFWVLAASSVKWVKNHKKFTALQSKDLGLTFMSLTDLKKTLSPLPSGHLLHLASRQSTAQLTAQVVFVKHQAEPD